MFRKATTHMHAGTTEKSSEFVPLETTGEDKGEIAPPSAKKVSQRLEDTVRGEVGAPNVKEFKIGTASFWKRVSRKVKIGTASFWKRVSRQLGLLPLKKVSLSKGNTSWEACFPSAKNDLAPSFLQIRNVPQIFLDIDLFDIRKK